MNIYESEHIYLKKASMDDTAAMYQNVWSDRDISKYMNFKPIDNLDDAKIMIQYSKALNIKRVIWAFWCMIRKLMRQSDLQELKTYLILIMQNPDCA